ncbi:BTB/POZ domain-containing protein [Cocos nucifera]|uniref:BTB/POZ domain-containing protein n=1 Tax=Cocos nucifera TaxID=13894 RepID=A0A8K0N1B9_COCNU|nr:BTB/POZ domain-containing protein [Cocos nucifera]
MQFPLISKCGYIRRLVSEANDSNISVVKIPDVPGGAEAFEFAAKFCYGINFEITMENIALLRCVAEYLEMTEDYAAGNLVNRTEDYLEEVALVSLSGAVTLLQKSEDLLPTAEKVKLVSRCIDAVAYIACKESQFSISLRTENSHENLTSLGLQPKAIVDWWAEELTVLRIDTFQRVLMAMKARGFKQYGLGPAHPSLSDVERKKVCSSMDCQRLSREACAHAAQNDRLPVQIVVQVLYYEQQRHRDVMSGNLFGGESPALPQKATPYGVGYHNADELSRLRRENADLKLELFRMRMQLKEIEKSSENITSSGKPPLPKKSFINSVSKKLGRLYPFMRSDGVKPLSGKRMTKPPKDRRHSIS